MGEKNAWGILREVLIAEPMVFYEWIFCVVAVNGFGWLVIRVYTWKMIVIIIAANVK